MSAPLPETGSAPEPPSRWELIRDIAAFQLKLAVDAVRDLVLIPVSLAAGAIDLISGGERPGRLFYEVLIAGRRSEHWINLFGEADRVEAPESAGDPHSVDAIVQRLEGMIVEQFERGGMTATAKDAIDRSLDAFAARATPRRLEPGSEDEAD